MDQISYDKLKFHPHSFADPDGRLFWLEGELYRAISRERTPFFAQSFQNGVIPELINRGFLIGSEPTGLTLDGYGMVLRHRSVPFVSYPHEWCAAMFKDAALAYLRLLRELVQRGLTLKDTHPWNLLFEGGRPVYVDVTSIRPLTVNSGCPDYNKFCRYYLYPLILMSQGQGRIARYLLPDNEGILQSDFSMLTGGASSPMSVASMTNRLMSSLQHRVPQRYRELIKNSSKSIQSLLGKQTKTNGQLDSLDRIRQEIEDVPLPAAGAEWPEDDVDSPIQQSLLKVISQLGPRSILAIGAKTQWYSRLAARLRNRIVSFDQDSAYITQLYFGARDRKLQILPLIMDFTDPTPSRGLSSHLSIAAAERLQCDLVLALGLVNKVISERRLRFDQVVDGLDQFSKRWLIVDFNPQQVRNMSDLQSDGFSRNTSENFTSTLMKRFRSVSRLPSDSETHTLLLCEK